jgi:uracil-DNA glycosylase family 4
VAAPTVSTLAGHVGAAAAVVGTVADLDAAVVGCRACPRLVAWREQVARDKRRGYAGQDYWGRPVPGFGPDDAALLVIGLAPAAHGANRTGRMFTGDRSGDVLYAALHRAGLASQPSSVAADDGLTLFGVRVTAPVRCAPPANRPTPAELLSCRPWLSRELALLRPRLRSVLVLGGVGWRATLAAVAPLWQLPRPRPPFGHLARARLAACDGGAPLELVGCYHVSQQNTFTGRLTPAMLDQAVQAAAAAAGLAG